MIDKPQIGLADVYYLKPADPTILMMRDAMAYAGSKILSIVDRDMHKPVVLSDTDSESDGTVLLGQDGFGEDKSLSSDTLVEYCKILPHCVPFNCHLNARHDEKERLVALTTPMEMA